MFGFTYHEYVQKYLNTKKHSKPNMIVAFNTGMHEADTESWKTSLRSILDLDIPAYFTSYSKEEAGQDFDILNSSDLNANILQNGPKYNQFREDHRVIEATTKDSIDKFFSCNMYGTLVKGKK